MTQKQSVAATGKKRGPYKNSGNKCTIPWHDHAPHECPGRARLKCAVCGKALIKHDGFEFCTEGDGEAGYVIDELGHRRRNKK